jgi:hypothetical protein
MASEIKSWLITDGKLEPINSSLSNCNRREREDLEQWIKSNPAILGDDIIIIGEQVATSTGIMDFIGVDASGNTVIVELKRDRLARDVLAQVIDYASDVSGWELERLNEVCKTYTGQNFEDYFQQKIPNISIDDLAINQVQRLLLVGFGVDAPLSRMVEWLSKNYNLGINAVVLNYVQTPKKDEILSRMVIIPEEVVKQKANKKKFIIEMSDEPGTYNEEDLESELIKYLSKDLYSSQRIKNYFLPVLLNKGKVTREQLRKEFVRLKAADDYGQAGNFLALISSQLGHKWKDYLRQVISYEYPNYQWEKDNFMIRESIYRL